MKFNEKFLKFFSKEELEEILSKASIYSEDVIYLNLDCGDIEISADIKDEIDIWFLDNNFQEKILSKEELLDLIKKCEKKEMECFVGDL